MAEPAPQLGPPSIQQAVDRGNPATDTGQFGQIASPAATTPGYSIFNPFGMPYIAAPTTDAAGVHLNVPVAQMETDTPGAPVRRPVSQRPSPSLVLGPMQSAMNLILNESMDLGGRSKRKGVELLHPALKREEAARHALVPTNAVESMNVDGRGKRNVTDSPMQLGGLMQSKGQRLEPTDAVDAGYLGMATSDPVALLLGPTTFEPGPGARAMRYALGPATAPTTPNAGDFRVPAAPAVSSVDLPVQSDKRKLADAQAELELLIGGIYDANESGNEKERERLCKKLTRLMVKLHPDVQPDPRAVPIFTRASQVKNGRILRDGGALTFGCNKNPTALNQQYDDLERKVDLRKGRKGRRVPMKK